MRSTISIDVVGNGYILRFKLQAPTTQQSRDVGQAYAISDLFRYQASKEDSATKEIERVFTSIDDLLAYIGVYLQSQDPRNQAETLG